MISTLREVKENVTWTNRAHFLRYTSDSYGYKWFEWLFVFEIVHLMRYEAGCTRLNNKESL